MRFDPEAELEAIMNVVLPEEQRSPDPVGTPVLPEALCARLSRAKDWRRLTGFPDGGVQFLIERALPHFQGVLRRNLAPNEAIFLALVFLRLGWPVAHLAASVGGEVQAVTRAVERGLDALGQCFRPFTTFSPISVLRELVSDEERDTLPERALESRFVVDGKHFKGRVYGGLAGAQSYYSHKLNTAGYQFQCIVSHYGQCVHVTDVEPAATHDITVYKKCRPLLLAGMGAVGLNDVVILADQGYRAPDVPELFIPSPPSAAVNARRLIVEHYFGRMVQVFASIRHRFRLGAVHLNPFVRALCYLTNYHVFLSPLKNDEYLLSRKIDLYIAHETERKRERHRLEMASRRQALRISQEQAGITYSPVSFSLGELDQSPSKRSPTTNRDE